MTSPCIVLRCRGFTIRVLGAQRRDVRTSRTCNQQDAIEYLQEKNRVLRKAIPRPIQILMGPAIGCYPRFV